MMTSTELMYASPYVAYSYAYPHKTAYRHLEPPVPLRTLWAGERRDALLLYLHIPFCEMRCGFCNLFTTVHPAAAWVSSYLETLERQAARVKTALGTASFARMAIGGGTPTYLEAGELERLFAIAHGFGVDPATIPTSVGTSPGTADADRLRVLREYGVGRISIGVQSFVDAEVRAVGRAQRRATVEQALERIRAAGFPVLNVDLIYGLPGQTLQSWRESLHVALRFAPEELYLYPLYVRPLTGIGRREHVHDDIRLQLYRAGRDLLLGEGYTQVSMRMFSRSSASASAPVYCCQEDGLVGLGCGARSYTRGLHYSSEYAVGAAGVRAIIDDYIRRPDAAFDEASYGFVLYADEQRRRYLIQSLLQAEGLDLSAYQRRFGSGVTSDFPELRELVDSGLAQQTEARLWLTETGLEYSDAIGPWLYSEAVRRRTEEYELR